LAFGDDSVEVVDFQIDPAWPFRLRSVVVSPIAANGVSGDDHRVVAQLTADIATATGDVPVSNVSTVWM
jgi:hypothetical protein